ncbi:hypothetical protein JCM33374_g1273 [Metschnikowia sp. JCM 33374]|nr:hypothetical protein JCM33374_g1273 [Metschnikowia sp. JCM 33374]
MSTDPSRSEYSKQILHHDNFNESFTPPSAYTTVPVALKHTSIGPWNQSSQKLTPDIPLQRSISLHSSLLDYPQMFPQLMKLCHVIHLLKVLLLYSQNFLNWKKHPLNSGHESHTLPPLFCFPPTIPNLPTQSSQQKNGIDVYPWSKNTHALNLSKVAKQIKPGTSPETKTKSNTPSKNETKNEPKNETKNETKNNPKSKTKSIDDDEALVGDLLPLLKNVTSQNFGGLLVDILKKYHVYIPLDDFYLLLYSRNPPDWSNSKSETPSTETPTSAYLKLKGLKICHLLLKVFQGPDTRDQVLPGGSAHSASLSTVNYHEFLRTFLALKIIFTSVQKSEVPARKVHAVSVPRTIVYKIYYILCQTLVDKYPAIADFQGFRQSLTLGQPVFGKLTNLVYPNTPTRRLGKRGNSVAHYIGLTLNSSIVDKEFRDLLELDIPQLRDHFNEPQRIRRHEQSHKWMRNVHATHKKRSLTPFSAPKPSPAASLPCTSSPSRKPLLSYVGPSCTYSKWDCSPRIWQTAPQAIPLQSSEAKVRMDNSMGALKSYDIDFGPLLVTFNNGIFLEENGDRLSKTLVFGMKTLLNASAPKEAYMHLYLVILLLVFPAVLASDAEISVASKFHLRASLNNCVAILEHEFINLDSFDEPSLHIFKRLLRKMIHLNELTSCKVKLGYAYHVFQEIIRDIESEANCRVEYLSDRSSLEDTLVRGVVTSIHAYNFKFVNEENSDESSEFIIDAVISIAKAFQKSALSSTEDIRNIHTATNPFDDSPQDVAYQIFKVSSARLHIFLQNPIIVKLPIPLITFIMLHFTNSMQYASFHEFQKRDPELSKETFKTWWVFSTMFQEYLNIISEVYALSETLSQPS